MNKTEALERLAPISEVTSRRIEHDANTRVVKEPDQVILRPGRHRPVMTLAPEGIDSMAKFTGITTRVADTFSADTFGRALSELLARRGAYNVIVRNNAITEFTPAGREGINPGRLMTALERAIPGDGPADFNRVIIRGEDQATVDVSGHRTVAVVANDIINAGVSVTFSSLGSLAPTVQSYAIRQWCLNGATSDHVLETFRGHGGGEGDDMWQWFRESVRRAYQSISGIGRQYQRMVEENVTPENRAAMLDALLIEAGIKDDLAAAVRARALAQPPENAYDLHNLVTYATTHDMTEPHEIDRARRATRLYASATEHARICPACHQSR
ncbi:hypothetical protein ES703_33482 [subsurface metagenome]